MRKPTYYLWKKDFSSEEEYTAAKNKDGNLGFRVVTYLDGQKDKDIHEGLKAVIKNHYICESLYKNNF